MIHFWDFTQNVEKPINTITLDDNIESFCPLNETQIENFVITTFNGSVLIVDPVSGSIL